MRQITLLAVAASLGGCATRPELYAMPGLPSVAADAPQKRVADVLDEAKRIQDIYGSNFKTAATWTDLSALPLIGAATAIAAIVFDAGKHQRKRVGFIGIGAGAYTATRSVVLPAGTSELFARGHAALGCIRAEGALFVGDQADGGRTDQLAAERALNSALSKAAGIYGAANLDGAVGEEQSKRFVTGLKALSDAMAAGEAARSESAQEGAAYKGAATIFGAAVSDVTVRVATKGREGRSVDYEALKSQLIANLPPVTATPPANGNGAMSIMLGNKKNKAAQDVQLMDMLANEGVIAGLYLAANAVNEMLREMAAATPKYVASLDRVKACPAKV